MYWESRLLCGEMSRKALEAEADSERGAEGLEADAVAGELASKGAGAGDCEEESRTQAWRLMLWVLPPVIAQLLALLLCTYLHLSTGGQSNCLFNLSLWTKVKLHFSSQRSRSALECRQHLLVRKEITRSFRCFNSTKVNSHG